MHRFFSLPRITHSSGLLALYNLNLSDSWAKSKALLKKKYRKASKISDRTLISKFSIEKFSKIFENPKNVIFLQNFRKIGKFSKNRKIEIFSKIINIFEIWNFLKSEIWKFWNLTTNFFSNQLFFEDEFLQSVFCKLTRWRWRYVDF